MKLYTFEVDGQQRIGVEDHGNLIDLGDAGAATDMLTLIRAGASGLEAVEKALKAGNQATYALEDVRLHAPIPRPGKILCSGINYQSHFEENPNAVMPEEPFFFAKLPSTVIGPGDAIVHTEFTQQLDYEVEFAVVIGKPLYRAAEDQVMDAVFGYTLLHDVSARDVQFKDNQITLGKNFDSFTPLGPCIVTKDELTDPGNVRLRSLVNGEVMQDGSTQEWLFSLPKLLSFLSRRMTLEPGDIISTGTPAGVGVFRKPPVFLKPGDVVVLEAEGIGRLENHVVA